MSLDIPPIENAKKSKKKYIWGAIIATGVLIAMFTVGFYQYQGYNNRKFETNITEADKNFKIDKFNEAKQSYQNALKYKTDATIQTKIKLCDDVEVSYKEFNNGTDLFNKKDYLGAYTAFKKVISQDEKRFVLAKDKISESSKLYIEEKITQAKDSASKTDYQNAITQMNVILAFDPPNESAKTLKAQYQSDLQKKAEDEKRAEEERQRKETELAKQKEIDDARNIIRIVSLYPSSPNSVGGVDLHIVWKNNSNKIIKYANFSVVPYNAVGDIQSSEIGGSNFTGRVTGPINPGVTYGGGCLWECAWYNNTIKSVKLTGVDITYMDGSTASVKEDQIQYIL